MRADAVLLVVLFKTKHLTAEFRVVECLGPSFPVPRNSKTLSDRLQFFEVDAAASLATNQFSDRLAVFQDHDAFSALGGTHKFGKTRFRFANGKFHLPGRLSRSSPYGRLARSLCVRLCLGRQDRNATPLSVHRMHS